MGGGGCGLGFLGDRADEGFLSLRVFCGERGLARLDGGRENAEDAVWVWNLGRDSFLLPMKGARCVFIMPGGNLSKELFGM